MHDSQSVPARYYARLCVVLETSGIDAIPLLDAAGIPRTQIQAPEGSLTMTQVDALLEAAMRATGRTDLSLELARALKLTSHSTVSYGMLSSPTAGYALRLVARYFGLILPAFRMVYATDARRMRLTVEPVWPMSHAALVFHLELIAAAVHWELRDLLGGRLPPYDVYFSLDEPAHVSRYAELRELRPHFGWRARPGFVMEWPKEVAARKLALSDPIALKLAETRCGEMLDKVRNTGNVAGWVHMMLQEASGGPPTLTELARTLNLSARTLDRYLQREGESFREMQKRVQHTKACTLLQQEDLSVTQIAYELGYADPSNFARAFRRESGQSPSAWRHSQAEQYG